MYYLVLCAQVGPQIEIKYKQGGKQFIHRASHRWTKFSGDNAQHMHSAQIVCSGRYWLVLQQAVPTHRAVWRLYIQEHRNW